MDGTQKPKQEIVEAESADQAPTSLISIIAMAVKDPTVTTDKMQGLIDVMERLERRDAEKAFNVALAEMTSVMPRVKKRGKVEYLVDKNNKNGPKEEAFKHAKIEDIDTAIRPLLVKYGFSLSFTTEPRQGDGGGLTMVGRLSHVLGHFQEARIAVALDNSGGKNNIQGMGSSSSYGKRYVTCMLLNIITEDEDDDGQSADPISIEKAVEIDLLITQVGADKVRFLKFMKVDSVPEIRAKDYKKAIDMLNAKKKAKV